MKVTISPVVMSLLTVYLGGGFVTEEMIVATHLTRLVVEVRMVFTCWGLIRRPNGGRMITK